MKNARVTGQFLDPIDRGLHLLVLTRLLDTFAILSPCSTQSSKSIPQKIQVKVPQDVEHLQADWQDSDTTYSGNRMALRRA
jgi:hypothetical protein